MIRSLATLGFLLLLGAPSALAAGNGNGNGGVGNGHGNGNEKHNDAGGNDNGNGGGNGNGGAGNDNGNNGHDNGQGNNGNGNGGGNGGNNAGGNGNGNGNAGGNGNGVGNGNGNTVGNGSQVNPPARANGSDQDQALDAVSSGQAMPLGRIVQLVAPQLDGGTVIDARLMHQNGLLLYELKVLLPSGEVLRLYVLAKTGKPVKLR